MKELYQKTKDELFDEFVTNPNGLSSQEAHERLLQNGPNQLTEKKNKSVFRVFLSQFADFLVIILIIAAVISMFSKNFESAIVIFAVIFLNALLGTFQYAKAQKSLDALKAMSAPSARVIRDGADLIIPAAELVTGDILLLEAGDIISADGRILHNYSLQVNESSLTGESANADKDECTITGECALADRTNMVYSGSLVTYGRAMVLVTACGMDTEIGKIANLMNATAERKTPLQISLDQFSQKLAIIIIAICGLVFGLGLYRHMTVLDSLLFAVALAVAAIPEALSSIVTIVQAMGTQKMAKEHAIIKELKAVESLGCVSVICSDKTGTLTQNKMTVQQIYIGNELLAPELLNLSLPLHRHLLYDAILTNDASLSLDTEDGIGDPTEYCLLVMARKAGINENMLRDNMQRLSEIPFDSERKLMSTKYLLHGEAAVLTKGAVDQLLPRCTHIETTEGVRQITEDDRRQILAQNLQFSENGLRVLAFGYKYTEFSEELTLENEQGYIFTGLVSIIDPPRPESARAVSDAKHAGIRPVMITGDHKITATAIAKQIGIFEEGDLAITGTELDAMTDEELDYKIEQISVYARVSPENKIRIVSSWQRKNHIVAMTGDGVNDAPALKKSDIGVAMGITGTEVSKDAASMILTDDNFATIIKAVANGRNVYRNIKNAILFLLSGNMAGILCVLYTSLLGLPVPFAAVQLLFINLVTDSLPAIAIGMEPAAKNLLAEPPRDPKENILNTALLKKLLIQGGLIAAATLAAYHTGLETDAATACTMAFAALTAARLFHGFNCRSKESIFKIGFKNNPFSIAAFVLGILLLCLVLFIPAVRPFFSAASLTVPQIGFIFGAAFVPTLLIQLYKCIQKD